MRLLCYSCLLLLACAPLFAQPVEAKHARLELIAENNGVTPGHQLLLGLHFQLEKDWHIYWINPGDSGQPPVVQWRLPSGFSAGEVQWPRPEKLKSSQSADYGYKDEVLLMVPVHVPPDLKNNSTASISMGVDAKWLICREVCIADHAQFHLALPASSTPLPDKRYTQLFANARKLLPKAWPAAWKATASSGKDDFVLSIQAGKPLREAEFFPLEPSQIENVAPQPLHVTARGVMITLKKSEQLVKPISKLKGLLVLPGGTAYQIVAPVAQP
ncbi:MAG TPA: protein-disulfide reductase DsbD domain-containing protein [Candidatus Angelobacter sp.]|jgi:thiol:disulfide interchange protein DsbD|nr:protein-disulfide reductase DsbD domain-containing protein [Candidatus Angelobacter sp.]